MLTRMRIGNLPCHVHKIPWQHEEQGWHLATYPAMYTKYHDSMRNRVGIWQLTLPCTQNTMTAWETGLAFGNLPCYVQKIPWQHVEQGWHLATYPTIYTKYHHSTRNSFGIFQLTLQCTQNATTAWGTGLSFFNLPYHVHKIPWQHVEQGWHLATYHALYTKINCEYLLTLIASGIHSEHQ